MNKSTKEYAREIIKICKRLYKIEAERNELKRKLKDTFNEATKTSRYNK